MRRRITPILALLILGSGAHCDMYAAPRKRKTPQHKETAAEVKKHQEAALREIKQTKEKISVNDAEMKRNLAQLSKLQEEIDISTKKVNVLNGKVNSLGERISSLETSISEGKREVERLRAEYLKAVKKMRVSRKNTSVLAFVFSADNFNQGLRRLRYLKQFSRWKDARSKEINVKVARLEDEARQLEDARATQAEALSKQRQAAARLETQRTRQNAIVADLRAQGAALQAHLSKKQAEANTLKSRVAALIAEEERKAAEEKRRKEEAAAREAAKAEKAAADAARQEAARNKNKEVQQPSVPAVKTPEDKPKPKKETKPRQEPKPKAQKETKPKKEKKPKKEEKSQSTAKPNAEKPKPAAPESAGDNGFASHRGSLPRPVDGTFRVTGRFGRHALPELPDVMYDNPGIDVEVAPGAPVKAVYGGKVSGVYMISGFGNVVIVSHGNYYTVYGNLASPTVKAGDTVQQGSVVGSVAPDPGDSSHGELHFEVWKNREKLDPLGWIR